MKPHLGRTLLRALRRVVAAPQHTFHEIHSDGGRRPEPSATSEQVVGRLENVFEALGDLPSQLNVDGALDLACDTLHSELPTAATAAGVYDIDADQIRIVAARGLEHDLLRGTILSRERCFAGYPVQRAFVTSGHAGGATWLGEGDEGSTVLLCPILHDANLLGVLALAEPLCAAEFTRDDLDLVGYVAEQLAGFVQSRRLRTSIAPAAARAPLNAARPPR